MKSKKAIGLIALVVVLFVGGYLYISQGNNVSKEIFTSVCKLENKDFSTNIDVTGALIANETVSLVPKINGKIKQMYVSEGAKVKAGDIIAVLDSRELDAQMNQARAGVDSALSQVDQARINMNAAFDTANSTEKMLKDQETQAKINLEFVERAYNRKLELVKAGGVTQSEIEDEKTKLDIARKQYEMARVSDGSSAQSQIIAAKSKYEVAKKQYEIAKSASVDQANANLNVVRVQLDNTVITSPITGVVTNKNLNEGELATSNNPIATISDISSLKLRGTVAQEFVPFLSVGQDVDITIDAYKDKKFSGKISKLGPVAVSTGMYFPIEIIVKNDHNLFAGFSAHAGINVKAPSRVTLPIGTLVENNGKSYVYVIKDGIAQKRPITIGLKSNTEVEILSGVEASDIVAKENVNNLYDGAKVVEK